MQHTTFLAITSLLWTCKLIDASNGSGICCQAPPDITRLKPPPKPPWLDYSLSCGKSGVEAIYDPATSTAMLTTGSQDNLESVVHSTLLSSTDSSVKSSSAEALNTKASPTNLNTSPTSPSQAAQLENAAGMRHFGAYIAIGVLSFVVMVLIAVLILVKKRYVRYPVQPDQSSEHTNFLWNYRIRGWKWKRRRRETEMVEPKNFAVVTMTQHEGQEDIELNSKPAPDSGSSSGISIGSSGSSETTKLTSHTYPDIVQSAIKPVRLPPIQKPKPPVQSSAPNYPILRPIEDREKPDDNAGRLLESNGSRASARSRRQGRNDDIPMAHSLHEDSDKEESSRSAQRRRRRRQQRERSEARRRALNNQGDDSDSD